MLRAFRIAYRPDDPPAGTPPPDPGAGPPAPAATGVVTPPVDLAAENQQLKAQLADTRREAAGYRTGNKGELAEFKKQMATALGLTPAEAPDVATLMAQWQEKEAKRDGEFRKLQIDSALGEIYPKHGVIPELARAVLESKGVLSALDPGDAEFSKNLNAAVKKLAEDYPQLKTTPLTPPPPPRSGVDFSNGNGAAPQLTREEVARMTPEAVVEARQKGQLNQLMGRTS